MAITICDSCELRRICLDKNKFYPVVKCGNYENINDTITKVEQTNEEWFCSLSTEEKADFMSRVLGCSNCPIPKDGRSCMGTYSGCWHEITKWLKQPHTEKE